MTREDQVGTDAKSGARADPVSREPRDQTANAAGPVQALGEEHDVDEGRRALVDDSFLAGQVVPGRPLRQELGGRLRRGTRRARGRAAHLGQGQPQA